MLDVQLPRWCELYLQNESAKAQPQIPIVFICSHDDIPMTVLLMKSSATDFLTKPFRDEDVLQAVEKALTRGGQSQ